MFTDIFAFLFIKKQKKLKNESMVRKKTKMLFEEDESLSSKSFI